MGNLLLSWVANHQQFFEGIALGAILSNPGTCAVILFGMFVKIPGVGLWISKNPAKAKSWCDEFDKAVDAQIDKYAASQEPPKA